MMTSRGGVRNSIATLLLAAVCPIIGCDSGGDRILEIDTEGTVFVFLYRDDDLNATYNAATDHRLIAQGIDLQYYNALQVVPGGPTDTLALRVFRVPVGRYVARVQPAVLGDSLEVEAGIGPYTVVANDSVLASVALKYKTVTITEARALPLGRAAWVRGIVMNTPFTFADSTIHLLDDSSAVRVTFVRPNLPLLPGDSGQFLGRRIVRDGQPAMELIVLPVIGGVTTPPLPDSVSTATAATADGGSRDAQFVKVAAATVSDTVTVGGALNLAVSDGTGALTVVLSPNINFGNFNQYAPGKILDISGLLVPDPLQPGTWVLKPRLRQDIIVLP